MRLGEGPFVWGFWFFFLDGGQKRGFSFGWREKWYGLMRGNMKVFLEIYLKFSWKVLGFGLVSQLAEGFIEMGGEREREKGGRKSGEFTVESSEKRAESRAALPK